MEFSEIKLLLAALKYADLYEREVRAEIPEGFKESFEHQPNFRGWASYHITWDVYEDDPWKCVLREKSQEEEWNETLEEVCPVLTPEGEIVTAEEWNQRSLNNGGESNVQ